MGRTDFAAPGRRTSAKGFRSKKAKRRAVERQRVHKMREAAARKTRAGQIKRDRARRAEGWWPPQ